MMFQERDLHSGLIGPLVICKSGTLNTQLHTQPRVQEFSLLFHTFDETKSWYMGENLRQHCAPPCRANLEDPWYHTSNKFAGRESKLDFRCHVVIISLTSERFRNFSRIITVLLLSNKWLRGRDTSWFAARPAPAGQMAPFECGQWRRVPCHPLPWFAFHCSH